MAEIFMRFNHPRSSAAFNRRFAALGIARRLNGFQLELATRMGATYCDITTPVGQVSEAQSPDGVIVVETEANIASVLVPTATGPEFRLICLRLPWAEDPLLAPSYVAILPADYEPDTDVVLGLVRVEGTSQELMGTSEIHHAFPLEHVGGGEGILVRSQSSLAGLECPVDTDTTAYCAVMPPLGASRWLFEPGQEPRAHVVLRVWGLAFGEAAAPNDVVRLNVTAIRCSDRLHLGAQAEGFSPSMTGLPIPTPGYASAVLLAELDLSDSTNLWTSEYDDWNEDDRLELRIARNGVSGTDTYPYSIRLTMVELEVVQRDAGALPPGR